MWYRVTRNPLEFYRLTGGQLDLGIGVSQYGIRAKVNDYLESLVGVSIRMVLIPASQRGIRVKVYDYL